MLNAIAVAVDADTEKDASLAAEAPTKLAPAGAAHLRPVGETVESATMLQLGKGIVLCTIRVRLWLTP